MQVKIHTAGITGKTVAMKIFKFITMCLSAVFHRKASEFQSLFFIAPVQQNTELRFERLTYSFSPFNSFQLSSKKIETTAADNFLSIGRICQGALRCKTTITTTEITISNPEIVLKKKSS